MISLAVKSKRNSAEMATLELAWCSIAAGETGAPPLLRSYSYPYPYGRTQHTQPLQSALSTLHLAALKCRDVAIKTFATRTWKHGHKFRVTNRNRSISHPHIHPHTHTLGVYSRAGTTVIKMASQVSWRRRPPAELVSH